MSVTGSATGDFDVSGRFFVSGSMLLAPGGVNNTGTARLRTYYSGFIDDITPYAFTFNNTATTELSTVYTSNAVTITGTNTGLTITISNGTYSINGGTYT